MFKFCLLAAALLTGANAAMAKERPLLIGGTGAALVYAQAVAAQVHGKNPDISASVINGLGSGGALRALAAGKIDVAISGRKLKQKEVDAGLVAMPLMRTPFGFFTSHKAPVAVTSDTVWQLYDKASEPNAAFGNEVVRVILRPESDSDRAFAIANFEGMEAALEQAYSLPGVMIAQTDQENASMAEQTPNTLTTGTLLQMISEKRTLAPLAIDGVVPSAETVRTGAYPYAKTLYLVTRRDPDDRVARLSAFMYAPDGVQLAARLGGHVVSASPLSPDVDR